MNSKYLDEIAKIIAREKAEAYECGKADAKRELLAFLGHNDSNAAEEYVDEFHNTPKTEGHENHQQRPSSERQRAPKGLVPKFIKRVLAESSGALAPKEILNHASDEFERMIKPASIRSALRAGRENGEFDHENGFWFLVSSEAEGSSYKGEPSASDDNNGGSSNAAALDKMPGI